MTNVDEVIRRQVGRDPRRFEAVAGDATMVAVVTVSSGGPEVLRYREVRRPRPGEGEVLIRVLAAGVNATDINTRVGWYGGGGWDSPSPFPFIQGADCCGTIEETGPGAADDLIGRRVLVRPCMRPYGFDSPHTIWFGTDFDGAFAEYAVAPASEVFAVDARLGDAELAVIPCAYGTAENMLARAGVRSGQHVVVTGASGGVGSAAVQLAAARGAEVTAITSRAKVADVLGLGAARSLPRDEDVRGILGDQSVDVIVDNVSGPGLEGLLALLRRGGVYVTSGAVAGPEVTFDKRTVYLRDLTLRGCTAWDEDVFPSLVAAVESAVFRPRVARTLPLEQIADAQAEFVEGRHVGSFVLLPPGA